MRCVPFILLFLAACTPSKMLPPGPIVHQSSVISESYGDTMVMARVMAKQGAEGTEHVVYFSIALPANDIDAAYAFDSPMPYVAETPTSGFITMSQTIFQKLSKTGFDVVLVGGTSSYGINVPAEAFEQALGIR
jgi:hypothetical protein